MNDVSKGFNIGCGVLAALVGIPALLCGGCLITGLATVQRAADKAAKRQAALEHTPELQKQRATAIARLVKERVFSKIEDRGGGLVRLWVGPAFDGLDFDDKQNFCGLVYAYHFDGTRDSDFIVLHDGKTGKEIGSVTNVGLKMR